MFGDLFVLYYLKWLFDNYDKIKIKLKGIITSFHHYNFILYLIN